MFFGEFIAKYLCVWISTLIWIDFVDTRHKEKCHNSTVTSSSSALKTASRRDIISTWTPPLKQPIRSLYSTNRYFNSYPYFQYYPVFQNIFANTRARKWNDYYNLNNPNQDNLIPLKHPRIIEQNAKKRDKLNAKRKPVTHSRNNVNIKTPSPQYNHNNTAQSKVLNVAQRKPDVDCKNTKNVRCKILNSKIGNSTINPAKLGTSVKTENQSPLHNPQPEEVKILNKFSRVYEQAHEGNCKSIKHCSHLQKTRNYTLNKITDEKDLSNKTTVVKNFNHTVMTNLSPKTLKNPMFEIHAQKYNTSNLKNHILKTINFTQTAQDKTPYISLNNKPLKNKSVEAIKPNPVAVLARIVSDIEDDKDIVTNVISALGIKDLLDVDKTNILKGQSNENSEADISPKINILQGTPFPPKSTKQKSFYTNATFKKNVNGTKSIHHAHSRSNIVSD